MTIYGLKGLIEALKKENNPKNSYLIEFYESLYQEQLNQIADKVKKQLDDKFYKSEAWANYLAK
jgi:hypothetical protein